MKSNFENQLEQAIRDAANQASAEPLPGHEERFETRLIQNAVRKKSRVVRLWSYSAVAAAAMITIVFTWLIYSGGTDTGPPEKFAAIRLSDVSYEMSQVEKFYTDKLSSEKVNIASPDLRMSKFIVESKRLEGEYKMLEGLLAKNPSNEKIINAMIANYQFRLRILESLKKYAEIKNQLNNPNNEKKTDL